LALAEYEYFWKRGLFFSSFGIPAHVLMAVYLAASAGVFFTPFLAAHPRMRDLKCEALKSIATRLEEQRHRAMAMLSGGNPVHLPGTLNQLEALARVYDRARVYPEWPFDFRIVQSFWVRAVGQPLVAILTAVVATRLRAAA
jgi:hypothetical protein